MTTRRWLLGMTLLALLAGGALALRAAGDTPTKKEQPKMMWCHACGFNLGIPGFRGKSDIYCSHCTDQDGKFIAKREGVQRAIADWFKTWQPNLDDAKAMKRADHYLKALPQWAEE